MIAFVINVAVALVWFFLGNEPDGSRLLVGYLLGFGLVRLFRGVLRDESYTRRSVAFVMFVVVFARELLVSNLQLAWVVLFRRTASLTPAVFIYSTEGLSKFEILVLSHCITLTPGTSTIDIENDFRELRLHALDGSDLDGVRAGIKANLEARILAFTR